jgi:hypothetical protein
MRHILGPKFKAMRNTIFYPLLSYIHRYLSVTDFQARKKTLNSLDIIQLLNYNGRVPYHMYLYFLKNFNVILPLLDPICLT